MKICCGTDIIEVDRIKRAVEKSGDKFLHKIFTDSEIEYCESKSKLKYQHYAARFAAKEAVYKAISKIIKRDYSWQDIEIVNEPTGKPIANLKFDRENIIDIDVSLSHIDEYATATAVITYEK
jgi:holo-[acyl-carrier protein] synthase